MGAGSSRKRRNLKDDVGSGVGWAAVRVGDHDKMGREGRRGASGV